MRHCEADINVVGKKGPLSGIEVDKLVDCILTGFSPANYINLIEAVLTLSQVAEYIAGKKTLRPPNRISHPPPPVRRQYSNDIQRD